MSTRTVSSKTSVVTESGKGLTSTDEPGEGETQEAFTTASGMSESDLLELEARVRAAEGASESLFASRSPFGQASTTMSQANMSVSQPSSSLLLSHTPMLLSHTHSTSVQIVLHPYVCQGPSIFMRVIIVSKMHKVKLFMYVEKIMSKMSSRISMTKGIDRIRSSIIFMKSMDKIESQLKRCRVLTVMNRSESIFKWQVMMTRQVEE